MTADEHEHNPDTVELATLILPSHAAHAGLESGDGDLVVLEARHETVENIASHQKRSQISAVVDLEVLSELAGLSEEVFITDLHVEATENREFEEKDKHEDAEDEEQQPLLAPPLTERITLTADPFIESLVEVLPSTKEEIEVQVAAEPEQREVVTEAAATKTDGDQHLAHDAFLLNIPNETSTGSMEDHFVLALPEIIVEPSIAESTLSGASIPLMERAMSLLPTIPSHLPTDVTDVHLEAHKHLPTKEEPMEPELHLDLVIVHQVPTIGYVILISGLVALSSVGAALDLQEGPSPTMKSLWRQMATCIVLSPLVAKSLLQDGFPQLTAQQWLLFPLSAISYAYMTLAFVVALDMTTMANAFVLSNMTSLVIIAGRAALGLPILRLEGYGAVIGFTGAAICANAAASSVAATAGSASAMLGNAVALSSSFGTALYLIVAKNLRSSLDLFVFMFGIMFFGSIFLFCYIVVSGEEYTFGMHPLHGLFGWINLTPDRLPLELYMAVVCNCLGTTGYVAVMKYFEPIVPATVMLMEPVIGSLLGVATGTAALPGIQTWFGDVVVAAGTFVVIWSGSKSTEKIDATEALRPSGDDASVVSMKSPLFREKFPQSATDEASAKVVWDH